MVVWVIAASLGLVGVVPPYAGCSSTLVSGQGVPGTPKGPPGYGGLRDEEYSSR